MRHFLFYPLFFLIAQIGFSAPVQQPHVEAELLSEVKAIYPGEPFTVAVKIETEKHWHTYWLNPGDSGLATEIKWSLPEGFKAGDIQWPIPSRIDLPPLTSYGYEGEATLLVQITPPQDLKQGTKMKLSAYVSWLVCKESCIPGKAELKLDLPVGKIPHDINGNYKSFFEEAKKKLPQRGILENFLATIQGREVFLSFRGSFEKAEFFPLELGVFNAAAVQKFEKGDINHLALVLSDEAKGLDRVKGVLVVTDTLGVKSGYEIDENAVHALPKGDLSQGSFFFYIVTAFFGGLILNLMPCVFPVLSIKILGLFQQVGEDKKQARLHGIFFAIGVILSFWILAGVLWVLRSVGSEIGWGFQLQSAWFVLTMALILFALALSMIGVFEIGTSLVGLGGARGYSRLESLWSGVLATLVATPCTAPFMGASVAFALSQPIIISMGVFTSLAVGLATPYVLLTWFPAFIGYLPKPGIWMESLKQAMSFPLFGAVVWLIWVLGQQAGNNAVLGGMVALLSLGIAGWIYGRWGGFHRKVSTQIIAYLLSLFFILISIWMIVKVEHFSTGIRESAGMENSDEWGHYSPEIVEKLSSGGKSVFVDFTAAWCLTCQVNKVVLKSSDVRAKFKEKGVVTLEADWTRRDPAISQILEALGRQGVPVYALYPAGEVKPELLPEILTKKILLDALDKLPTASTLPHP